MIEVVCLFEKSSLKFKSQQQDIRHKNCRSRLHFAKSGLERSSEKKNVHTVNLDYLE